MVDFTSPKLAVLEIIRTASITFQAAARPPFTTNESTAPPADCCFMASACCGWDSSPG